MKNGNKKALYIIGGIIAGVLAVVYFVNESHAHALRLDELKKSHADEMAECLKDWKDGKNGECEWEEKTLHVGGGDFWLVDVEVIARPLE